jgi:hypothetical protein
MDSHRLTLTLRLPVVNEGAAGGRSIAGSSTTKRRGSRFSYIGLTK